MSMSLSLTRFATGNTLLCDGRYQTTKYITVNVVQRKQDLILILKRLLRN